ncbi:MAG TPA: OsmC family protein [Mycobacteriales bacterium]|nr:OsmC family protein [Mycobacteriales bacterium]
MTAIQVRHEWNDRFSIDVRGHRLYVDQPEGDGGDDTAPTPTELLVASLASCVAFYARRYLSRHGLSEEGLVVSAEYTLSSRPARVGHIDVQLTLPDTISADRRAALLAVASHCTVHNSLIEGPMVRIALTERSAVA